MLYLSSLPVNIGGDPNRPRPGRMWVQNPYRVHQRICMAFPDRTAEQHREGTDRVLFRIEGTPFERVLVQSAREPDWESCFEAAAFLLRDRPQVKKLSYDIAAGAKLRFLLHANPTRKAKGEAGQNGQRLGITTPEGQVEWLNRKAARGGFTVLSVQILSSRMQTARRSKLIDTQPHRHLAVAYAGLLEVTDPAKFGSSLAAGIGSAKAYGFGLLSIAPA